MASTVTKGRSLITYSEAADELGISARGVRRIVDAGQLPAVRVGRRSVRILRDDLERYVAERRERRANE